MKSLVIAKLSIPIAISIIATLGCSARAQNDGEAVNIALGKQVTVFPIPNSPEPGNKPERLTDGNPEVERITKEETTAMWVQPGAIGWAMVNPAAIVVDLGKESSISGVSYRTAAGIADVTWPSAIYVAVSDDQKTWRYAGDLVQLSAKQNKPPKIGSYHEFTFSTQDIRAKGRYVAFGIGSELYITTDEVEVYAGDEAWLTQSDDTVNYPNQPDNVLDYMRSLAVKQKQTERIESDVRLIRAKIAQSNLGLTKKNALLTRLMSDQKLSAIQPLPSQDFKAIAPVSDAHRQVLSVYGELLAAQGFKPLSLWSGHRYSWLPLLATPPKAQGAALDFSMLKNQFRPQSFLLTNASSAPQTVQLILDNAPKDAQQDWLKVDAVEWTDTHQGVVVADALLPAPSKDGVYSINIPAGMTRKVWVTVDSSKVPAGKYKTAFEVKGQGINTRIPLNVDIATIVMQRPRVSLGMWDDADSAERGGALGITMKNRDAALKLMQSHYVDTAWGKRPTLPWPEAKDFDADGKLNITLDFTNFDKWIKSWPEGRHFFSFIYAGDTFAGIRMGTPEFNLRVGNWAKELSKHMTKLGLEPRQLGFLIIDEQRTEEHDTIVANWATAFKSGAPELTIFQNPNWERPDLRKDQRGFAQVDILSPSLGQYLRTGEPVKKYYENLRQQGKEIWFYQCAGPVRLFDPQRYYRYQSWHTYAVGGTGHGFWSFGDIGINSRTSWNDYSNSPYFTYTPQFVDIDTMQNSVHWDAVRDGITDYEELAMLKDAIALTKDAKLRAQAQKVHDDAVRAVTGIWEDTSTGEERFSVNRHVDWQRSGFDTDLADRHLKSVRAMLKKLNA